MFIDKIRKKIPTCPNVRGIRIYYKVINLFVSVALLNWISNLG